MSSREKPYRPSRAFGARRGLATPVSMLVIFFSLTLVSTVAYYHAVSRIDAKKEDLKLIAAEEKMLDLEEAISSAAWSPGSARVVAFSDYGGELHVEPGANHLEINVTLGNSSYIEFDSDTGRFLYELPSTVSGHLGRWLRGDQRAIVNRSSAYQAQAHIEGGDEREELRIKYRPLVSSSVGGLSAGRRVNNIRIYIINLNGSQTITSGGEFHLKVLCRSMSIQVHTYNVSSAVTSASIKATLSGSERTVVVPLTSGPSGSTIRVEVVVSHIELQGVSV